MYILFFIVALIAVLVLQTFELPATAAFRLDTERSELCLTLYWLNPFIRARVAMSNYAPLLTGYLFNIRIVSRKLKAKAGQSKTLPLRTAALSDISIKTCFGFESPFFTGILSGALQALESYFQNAAVSAYPDFLADREYLIVQGSAKLNIGKTVLQSVKMHYNTLKRKRSDYHGSAQYV
jgi:hypothetical protein